MFGNRNRRGIGRALVAGTCLALFAPSLQAGLVDLIHRDGFEDVLVSAFRITDIDLRDPHAFASVGVCLDLTNDINSAMQTSIQGDEDGDGYLDASELMLFQPLQQGDGGAGVVEGVTANCTAPVGGTSCTATADAPLYLAPYVAFGSGGACLGPLAGTTRASYTPQVSSSITPCFVASADSRIFNLAGIPIALFDVDVAATFVGVPASQLSNGLLRGFLTEPTANATIIPPNIAVVGGQPLSRLFPGGTNNCSANNDKDSREGVSGWWIYLNFTAARVPYIE